MHCKRCGKEIIGEIQRYCNSCKKEIEYKNNKGHKKVEIEQVSLPKEVVDDLSATKEFRMPSSVETPQTKSELVSDLTKAKENVVSEVAAETKQTSESIQPEPLKEQEVAEAASLEASEAKSERVAEALMKQVEEAKKQSAQTEEASKKKKRKEKKAKKQQEEDDDEPVRKKGCLMKILEILVVLAGITVVFALCFKFGYKIFDILDLLQF